MSWALKHPRSEKETEADSSNSLKIIQMADGLGRIQIQASSARVQLCLHAYSHRVPRGKLRKMPILNIHFSAIVSAIFQRDGSKYCRKTPLIAYHSSSLHAKPKNCNSSVFKRRGPSKHHSVR